MRTPVHIPCATGGSVQADCTLSRCGDLLRIVGYGVMDFTPCDAMELARSAALHAVECGYRNGEELARVAEFWRDLARRFDPNEDEMKPEMKPDWKFAVGDRVRKKSGSAWQGRIVGWYSTALTPFGYCVESECHAGSVQIYPANALESAEYEI